MARAFGLVGHACAMNEVWKVWEGRQSIHITLKEFENEVPLLNKDFEQKTVGKHELYFKSGS